MLVIRLYPRQLRFQLNKENFRSSFFTGMKLSAVKCITNGFRCRNGFNHIPESETLGYECNEAIVISEGIWSIYSGVFHPHPILNYCQLNLRITGFISQSVIQCFRIWPYVRLISHKSLLEKKMFSCKNVLHTHS